MQGIPGRPSVAAQAAAERAGEAMATAAQVTVAAPTSPHAQRVITGYRVVRTFSDIQPRRPHRIVRAGEVLTDKREIERLAKAGAELEPVDPEQVKPRAA